MKVLIGKKGAMRTVYTDDGFGYAATEVVAAPCVVTQVKEAGRDGYAAVQVGYGTAKRQPKAQAGHTKGLDALKRFCEFRIDDATTYERGQKLTVEQFGVGDKVHVSGKTKGKGFQGVVKRHGFHGSPASHGHKDQLRMPGSIGATGPARVFKGTKMPGRMGGGRDTMKNLEVLAIDTATSTITVKGAIPGAFGSVVELRAEGEPTVVEQPKQEAQTEES